ncbi:MAG: hypothetical protein AB1668_02215 [Nanoarchaeota archaeon]
MSLAPEITTKEVIIDTIPFSYLLMGIHHQKTKQKIKPIAGIHFEENKAKFLALMLKNKIRIITPEVLAETSNQAKKNIKNLDSFLLNTKEEILGYQEEFVKKEILLETPSLFGLGITDLSLLKIGNKERTLLTGEERRELDHVYENVHQVPAMNIQDIFLRFKELNIK